MTAPARAEEPPLETLLRTQVFNKVFEGFDFYQVTIERDVANTDGTREVTAEAKGKFFDHTRRLKALFQLDGQTIIAGQVLEEEGLPACSASSAHHGSEL
jgi:L-rhamnose isomerase